MSSNLIQMIWDSFLETIIMVAISGGIGALAGIPLGILLFVTDRKSFLPMPGFNAVLGTVINALRSVPFIILLVAIIPFTRLIVGSSIGTAAAIVPLTLSVAPFIARIVETSLREVDKALARENWKPGAAPAELVEELKQQDQSFMDALEDDVNTAAAMGHLFNMVRIAGRVLEDKKLRNSEGGRDILKAFRDATAKWDTLLGLFAQKPEGFLASLREIRARRRGLDMNKVAGLLRERQEARAAKDFARSDAARDELAALGVEVRDTPEGPVWDII